MSKLILYKCESPLHAGSDNELGLVDMPIQREKHTGFPKIESSSLKGVFRYNFSNNKLYKDHVNIIFGSDDSYNSDDTNKFAGNLSFSDAKILFFPVKSAKGIFGWITCPFVLNRFNYDLKIMGLNSLNLSTPSFNDISKNEMLINENSNLIIKCKDTKYIVLEEFGYKFIDSSTLFDNLINSMNLDTYTYIKEKLKKDIAIVNDEVFSYFIQMSTEVNTRIRIAADGVVKDGALFTEEYLPNETILYSFIEGCVLKKSEEELKKLPNYSTSKVMNLNIENSFKEYFEDNNLVQLGGNSTLGKGIVSLHFIGEGEKK